MLRVGLTGGLGSGKSTVAQMMRDLGAQVIESDELGHQLMESGQAAFNQIVRVFGSGVLSPDGRLNRAHLAELAFKGGRIKELNAIIHPAVIEAQHQWMDQLFARDPSAVAVVVSALIFEVERDAKDSGASDPILSELRKRIDRIVLVSAPDEEKIARYVARVCPTGASREKAEADARSRVAHQIPDSEKIARADYVLENTGDIEALRAQVDQLWPRLQQESNLNMQRQSLK
jgi:dephospho-CoA kinase